jgi:hypothetical protein
VTSNAIDAVRGAGALARLTDLGRRTWLRFLASQEAKHAHKREEEAIEAEDYWEQAEEVCSVDPIG